ncbi:MAG: FAD-dependent oxidoreductase [Chloroflexi bacterium]|nr:FAD-dependent oxidoreductase [Chloroflexota bacterium]
MFDYEVAIIGGGPAGLAAGIYLSRHRRKAVLLDDEGFGGSIRNLELIENYPGLAEGTSGADMASEMVNQAMEYGLALEQAEVTGLDLYSSCRIVKCAEGPGYTTSVLIIAGGTRPKKLGVPGEDGLRGKGVMTCGFCEAGEYSGRVVAVCGSGDPGLVEALHLAKLASKVIILEASSVLRATRILQERALANPKLEFHFGVDIESIKGDSHVEAIEFRELQGNRETLGVDGVLVHIGREPNTEYLRDVVPLNSEGRVMVNSCMETEVPFVLAAGDVRSGSPKQIVAAVGDGATAAATAIRLLQGLE